MTKDTIKKKNSLKSSIRLMIILASVFALLLVGYFAILRPMLQQEEEAPAAVYPPIWASEVESVDGRVMMYPHYQRSNINKITVHNPDNAKFGEQYVDWGFYRYNGPKENEEGLVVGEYYLQNYDYAPFDSQQLAYMISAAGYTLTTARIEDHCDDFSRYGLNYATPEEAVSLTLETADGKTYVYYIGDKIPSGGGYYVRVVGQDTLLATGEKMERDSVYIMMPTYLDAVVLRSPTELVTPTLALPFDNQSTELMESFRIWINDEQYIIDVEDDKGNVSQKLKPAVYLKPIEEMKDPFSLFSGLGIYYSVSHPGYYSSIRFEALTELFTDFTGEKVVELASKMLDEDGEEYYGFDYETRKKYFLDDPEYTMCYRYQEIDNYVYFSALQEDSYFYAYSLTFNTICKVTVEQAYFLLWDEQTYLQNQISFLNIDNCDVLKLSGKYYDLGIIHSDRKGWHEINETYQLTGTGKDLIVSTADGKTLVTDDFRRFYSVMISLLNHDEVTNQEAEEAMKSEPVNMLTVTTRKKTVYKQDANGVDTSEVDYVLESVTKIFRFYKLTDGRLLCTIEQIDAEGKSSGENGKFYVLTSRMEQLLSASLDLREGKPVDHLQRY